MSEVREALFSLAIASIAKGMGKEKGGARRAHFVGEGW